MASIYWKPAEYATRFLPQGEADFIVAKHGNGISPFTASVTDRIAPFLYTAGKEASSAARLLPETRHRRKLVGILLK
jgi:hypothetical protein